MAIIYSYPLNQNILATDIIVGTTTAVVNGRPRNQTKSFEVVDLATFINAGNTLDSVLHNGNTSFLDAKVGSLGLYDITEQDYAKVSINDSEYNFYNAFNTLISTLTNNSLVLYPGSYTGQLVVPTTITSNRVYTFPNQSGTVALISDIPSLTGYVPYTGATGSVNLGTYNLTANSIIKAGGTNLQYLLADGSVTTGPVLTGFVPYTGATQAVDLGAYNLTVNSISIGKGAGTGINNTAIGNSVLVSNTTGTYNVAVGFEALKVNTTGGTNIAIGRGSLQANTTGGANTSLGYNSMFSNTSGGNNVSIGNGVMTGNTTGSGNVAIGYNTLTVQSTVSNTVAIGTGALQFNNSGTLNTAVGYASLTANTSGSNNTALGASALQNNNAGSENTALGMYVLINNNSGTGNTGVGKESLRANTTGGYNVGLGRFSLYSNTTGDQNTATGVSALSSITTGSFNVGVGVNSMSNSTTAYNNVAVGYNSIQGTFGASNTGYNNVGIGYYGLRNNTSGFENIGVGYNSLLLNPSDNNSIVIGSNATGIGSNTVVLGNNSITTTRLRGAVQGGSFVKDGGTSSQYLMADGSVSTLTKSTYMMTGVFTNMFGGDPGGLNKDVLDWVASSPTASHASALPILQNCRITAAGFKWISSTPIGTISAGDSWTVQVFKMINPSTDSTTADSNFTFLANLNITLTSANSGTTPGLFSSGLNIVLNAGDIIRIAGVETGAIGTTTEESQLTLLFETI